MNILFLDYDGVVNTPQWRPHPADPSRMLCTYNFPSDNKVNDFQCVQWISEFCQKYNYHIVVTSSWRWEYNYKECLINGGLRQGIEILGKTPDYSRYCGATRGDEIQAWLDIYHEENINFLIVDDTCEEDLEVHKIDYENKKIVELDKFQTLKLQDRFIQTNTLIGFREPSFHYAEQFHQAFNANKGE